MLEGRGKIEDKFMSSLNLHEPPVIGRKTIRLMISKLIYLFTHKYYFWGKEVVSDANIF